MKKKDAIEYAKSKIGSPIRTPHGWKYKDHTARFDTDSYEDAYRDIQRQIRLDRLVCALEYLNPTVPDYKLYHVAGNQTKLSKKWERCLIEVEY